MIDLTKLQDLGKLASDVLKQAETAAPEILTAAQSVVTNVVSLYEKAKTSLDSIMHPKMNDAETATALTAGADQLKKDMDEIGKTPVRDKVPNTVPGA